MVSAAALTKLVVGAVTIVISRVPVAVKVPDAEELSVTFTPIDLSAISVAVQVARPALLTASPLVAAG